MSGAFRLPRRFNNSQTFSLGASFDIGRCSVLVAAPSDSESVRGPDGRAVTIAAELDGLATSFALAARYPRFRVASKPQWLIIIVS